MNSRLVMGSWFRLFARHQMFSLHGTCRCAVGTRLKNARQIIRVLSRDSLPTRPVASQPMQHFHCERYEFFAWQTVAARRDGSGVAEYLFSYSVHRSTPFTTGSRANGDTSAFRRDHSSLRRPARTRRRSYSRLRSRNADGTSPTGLDPAGRMTDQPRPAKPALKPAVTVVAGVA